MRLLNATTYKFHEYVGRDVPKYAVLSHTWGEDEVTFHDMRCEAPPESWKAKLGWDKIKKCCILALADSIQFVWVDTCCIDKSSSAELQEAINSKFRWYEESTECYVFVADFEAPPGDVELDSTRTPCPRIDPLFRLTVARIRRQSLPSAAGRRHHRHQRDHAAGHCR